MQFLIDKHTVMEILPQKCYDIGKFGKTLWETDFTCLLDLYIIIRLQF